MKTTIVCWGYIGIMEKKMETTIVCWGYIGIMEKQNGNYSSILGLYWGLKRLHRYKRWVGVRVYWV